MAAAAGVVLEKNVTVLAAAPQECHSDWIVLEGEVGQGMCVGSVIVHVNDDLDIEEDSAISCKFLIRRVIGTARADGKTTLFTRPAEMSDLFWRLSISNVSTSANASLPGRKLHGFIDGVGRQAAAAAAYDKANGKINAGLQALIKMGKLRNANAGFRDSALEIFAEDISMYFSLEDLLSLSRTGPGFAYAATVGVRTRTTLAFSFDTEYEVKAKFPDDKEKLWPEAEITLPQFFVMAGPVPLGITVSMKIGFLIEIELKASTHTAGAITFGATSGARIDTQSRYLVTPIFEPQASASLSSDLTGCGPLTVKIGVEIKPKVLVSLGALDRVRIKGTEELYLDEAFVHRFVAPKWVDEFANIADVFSVSVPIEIGGWAAITGLAEENDCNTCDRSDDAPIAVVR